MNNRRWITVIDKMIFKDLLKTFSAVLSVIVIIIVSRNFIKVLGKAVEGEISGQTVMMLLGLKTLVAIAALMPPSIFIAVLMVLGRMYRDQEMSALASAGLGTLRLFRSVFLLMIPLSLGALAFTSMTVPWAEAEIERQIHTDSETADLRGISAGRFSEYSQGELVFYVETINDAGVMQQVFVQNRRKNQQWITNAKTGVIKDLKGGRYLILYHGERVQAWAGSLQVTTETFEEYAVRLEAQGREVNYSRESVSTEDLLASNQLPELAELQRRIAVPLSLLLLSALAIPLAQISPRGGVYGNLATAFLVYFIFSNIQKISESWLMKGETTGWTGFVIVYFVMTLIVLLLLVRLYGIKGFLVQFKNRQAL